MVVSVSPANRKDIAMKWPKDRRKAFLLAAEAFGTPETAKTRKQKQLTQCGICYTIRHLTGSREAYDCVFDIGEKIGITGVYWWPTRESIDWTPSCDKERSLFCYLMAALSDKEFEELQA